MVSSEEVVERSLYMRILTVALANNLTLDPANYLPASSESVARFKEDKAKLQKYVSIFGVGNNQAKGVSETPRIALNLHGYYPGHIGVERYAIDDTDPNNLQMVESSYITKDISIDVHLVANNQADLRLLHNLLYKALPTVGYIVPYINGTTQEYMAAKITSNNNLFMEIGNFYDHSDLEHGLLEKVYQYVIRDGVIDYSVVEDVDVVPITSIEAKLLEQDTERSSIDIVKP